MAGSVKSAIVCVTVLGSSERACHLLLLALLIDYSSTLNMEAICSPEMPDSLQTTRRYNPQGSNI
jgi:hypothetical protein